MDKRLIFPGNTEKERDLFLVQEDRNYLRKHASAYHPKVAAYIEKAQPLPDLVQILMTSLSAFPFWPQNVNGDRFYEKALAYEGPTHGYRTFTTDANYFTHHVNKDPALAKGKVLHAVWNEKAKRVELVVGIDVNKDPEAINSIDNGEDLCFSMGCFPAGTLVRMADGSARPIELVKVGDSVINHLGESDLVKECLVREHSGELLEFTVLGQNTFQTTPEHPIFAVSEKNALHHPTWVGARHLNVGDFVACPVNGTYVLASILSVKSVRADNVKVYNFEIEKEHSYLVGRIAVHNCKVPYDVCSICMNKAKTRADYCDHLRYMMNQMDPETGKLVGADNTLPRFFDISRVLIPADKTAHMWEKVASASNPFKKLSSAQLAELPPGKLNDMTYLMKKVAEQEEQSKEAVSKKAAVKKKATITKQVPLSVGGMSTNHIRKVIPAAKAALQADEPILPPETLAELKKAAPEIEKLLSTVLLMGIQPKQPELESLGIKPGDMIDIRLSPEQFSPEVAQHLLPHMVERSYARPYLAHRMVNLANKVEKNQGLTKKATNVADFQKSTGTPPVSPGLVAGVAAALYALLGHKFVADHPIFSLALGVTGLATLNSFRGARTSGLLDVDLAPGASYNKGWQRSLAYSQAHPVTVINKTGAAESGLVKKAFFGLPLLFLAADFQKQSNDQSPGSLSQFIVDHPDLLDAGATANDSLSFAEKSLMVHDALKGGERIFKEASLQNLEFLSAVPEERQALFWDLAILDSANRIQKKLGG